MVEQETRTTRLGTMQRRRDGVVGRPLEQAESLANLLCFVPAGFLLRVSLPAFSAPQVFLLIVEASTVIEEGQYPLLPGRPAPPMSLRSRSKVLWGSCCACLFFSVRAGSARPPPPDQLLLARTRPRADVAVGGGEPHVVRAPEASPMPRMSQGSVPVPATQ